MSERPTPEQLAAEIQEGFERFLGRLQVLASPGALAFVERDRAVLFSVYMAGWGAGRAVLGEGSHAAGPPDVWCAWLEADDHLRPWAGWASWSDEGERYVALDNKLNATMWRTRAEAAEVGTPVPVYFAALRAYPGAGQGAAMSERPTPEQLAEELLDGAILRLAEEVRVLALAARDEMERLREQVIEARAEADRRVAEERAAILKFLRMEVEPDGAFEGVPVWRAVQELADAIERGEHLRDRRAP